MVIERTKPIDALAYTTSESARVTGRSHTRIKLAIRQKELTARKDGRATLIERAELQRWLATMPTIVRTPEAMASSAAKDSVLCPTPPPRARSNARSNVLENSRR
jgi:excisionase family DNA binding protein